MAQIRGYNELVSNIGYPDITDTSGGGIAIWNRLTLKSRGFGFLHRVEIIDEVTPSYKPITHFSNIYIWIPITMTPNKIDNILEMSTDFMYDKGKGLLIVRSNTFWTALAQGALLTNYARDKYSYYDIYYGDLLRKYFKRANKQAFKKYVWQSLINKLS